MQSLRMVSVLTVAGLCAGLHAQTAHPIIESVPSIAAETALVEFGPREGFSSAMPRIPVTSVCSSPNCVDCNDDGSIKAKALKLIEAQTFMALPAGDRAKITVELAKLGEDAPAFPADSELHPALRERSEPLTDAELEEAWVAVKPFVDRASFERFNPIHQRMLANLVELVESDDWMPAMACFTPGVDGELIMAFEEVISYGLSNLQDDNPLRFEQIGRWNGTALDPGGGGQGNPTILTYSFPPDGTSVGNGIGEGVGPNDLNAFLDGIYGNRATWRAIYDQVFARWGELSEIGRAHV